MAAARDPSVPERKLTIPSASDGSAPHSCRISKLTSVQINAPDHSTLPKACSHRHTVDAGLKRKSSSVIVDGLAPASTRSAEVRKVRDLVASVRKPNVSP